MFTRVFSKVINRRSFIQIWHPKKNLQITSIKDKTLKSQRQDLLLNIKCFNPPTNMLHIKFSSTVGLSRSALSWNVSFTTMTQKIKLFSASLFCLSSCTAIMTRYYIYKDYGKNKTHVYISQKIVKHFVGM